MGYATRSRPTRRWCSAAWKIGVTPLGWTYAYTTLGNDGDRVSGTLAPRAGRQPGLLHPGHRQGRQDDQGRRQRLDPHPGDRRRHRRGGEEHPRNGRLQRHRHARPDRRRRPVGQDGDDREQRRRLVLRRHRDEVTACVWVGYADTTTPMTTLYNGGPVHGRHLPGPDLGQRDLRLGGDQDEPRRRDRRPRSKAAKPSAADPSSRRRNLRRHRSGSRSGARRSSANRQPAAEEAAAEAEAAPAPEAAPESRRRRRGGGVTAG